MPGHDIITIGASAGGVEALTHLVRDLPADLPAAIFVVVHVPAHGMSILPQILSRKGPLPARHPTDGEKIEIGKIYVAPPASTCSSRMARSGSRRARRRTATGRPSILCSARPPPPMAGVSSG